MLTGAEIYVVAVTGLALGLLASERLPHDIVGVGVILALVGGGVLELPVALRGLANPAVITLASLFVVSEAVVRTGMVTSLGKALADLGRDRPRLVLPGLCGVAALCSGFINNTANVVLWIPILIGLADRLAISPSRLLLPVAFASILGGTCTLIGTSTNLLVNSFAGATGASSFEPLGMFEFLPLGIVFSVVGIVYLVTVGRRLLPDRRPVAALDPPNRGAYSTELRLLEGSPLIGRTLKDAILEELPELQIVELIRDDRISTGPTDRTVLEEGDILLVRGPREGMEKLLARQGVEILPELREEVDEKGRNLAEIAIPPDSHLVGRTLEAVAFGPRHGVDVVAIQRTGAHIRKKVSQVPLHVGDVLLLRGDLETLRSLRSEPSFLLLEGITEAEVDPWSAFVALGVLVAFVLLASAGPWPIALVGIGAAFVLMATGCLSTQRAYEAVRWDILVLVASMIALGQGMESVGLTSTLAGGIEGATAGLPGSIRPHVVLAVLFLVIALLSNILTNNATAILFVPLVLEMATSLGVDARPFLLCVAFGASTAFLLPVGYQTHLLIFGPGGYRTRDFLRVGGPLTLLLWVAASVLIPVFWPFHP